MGNQDQNVGDSSERDEHSRLVLMAKRAAEFYHQFEAESERGSVIICATIMDDSLKRILELRLVPSCERDDELFEGPYAPLGGFSAKIDFAYRVGIIGVSMRSGLHFIRKIRNEFAHSPNVSFESPKIHCWIQEIFKLFDSILYSLWELVQREKYPEVEKKMIGFKSQYGFDYIVRLTGWRSTFELIAAIIGSGLHDLYSDIEPLVFHTKEKEDTAGPSNKRDEQ